MVESAGSRSVAGGDAIAELLRARLLMRPSLYRDRDPSAFAALRVLYVTDRYDAPYRYRCVHACEQLRDSGVAANILHLDAPDILAQLPKYSLVVLFRLGFSDSVERIIEAARASGAAIAYDIDDLVFGVDMESQLTFLRDVPAHRRRAYRRQLDANLRTMKSTDFCIASTNAIARAAERHGVAAFVHPNLLSKHMTSVGDWVHSLRPVLADENRLIYLSGSATHDRDLASISDVLTDVLKRRANTSLVLVGHVEVPEALSKFSERITTIPYLDFRIYPLLMARAAAVLAPIAERNEFTDAKSALKVFEPGIFGVPAIATPIAPYLEAVAPGVSGYLPATADEWALCLHLVLDRAQGVRLGQAARDIAVHEYTQRAYRNVLAARLVERAGRFNGPAPAEQPIEISTPGMESSWRSSYRYYRDAARALLKPIESFARVGGSDRVAAAIYEGSRRRRCAPRTILIDESIALADAASLAEITLDGRWATASSSDPRMILAAGGLPSDGVFLEIRIAIAGNDDIFNAQLFWAHVDDSGFAESRSLSFEVVADGATRSYVLDLSAIEAGGRIRIDRLRQFRLDPMDAPGRFLLDYFGVFSQDPYRENEVAGAAFPPVDIVIPVYNAAAFTRACVESVVTHARGDWRLVLVDDASTDKDLSAWLIDRASTDARIIVLRNEKNSGFVLTADKGMRAAAGRDVLLLNSDTEVFEGFLERLQRAAYSKDTIGFVTPFSNNATIYSIPEFARDNDIPVGFSAESFARLVSGSADRSYPPMVTGVGFCMYVRATVLESVGYFDTVSFGRGYGEENDLCQRGRRAGYEVRLADDVFVYHKGRASFSQGPSVDHAAQEAALAAKHPTYHAEVARFIESNPLRHEHERIKFFIARRAGEKQAALLYMLHSSPFVASAGGTEHHVLDLIRGLALPRVVVAYPRDSSLVFDEILDGDVSSRVSYVYPLASPTPRFGNRCPEVERSLARAVAALNVGFAHIHHLMFWPVSIGELFGSLAIPYVITLHDYHAVCMSWNLFDRRAGVECICAQSSSGAPGFSRDCLLALYGELGVPAPESPERYAMEHRHAYAKTLEGAKAVIAPSQAALDLIVAKLPSVVTNPVVIEHGYPHNRAAVTRATSLPLRVAIVGQVAEVIKGALSYVALIRETKDLPIEWHFFGDTQRRQFQSDVSSIGANVIFHGAYEREHIVDELAATDLDLCVNLPSWRETFSYTLSEALVAGLPVIARAQGAIADRVLRDELGWIANDTRHCGEILRELCADPSRVDEGKRRVSLFRHREPASSLDDHRRIYDEFLEKEKVFEGPVGSLAELYAVRESTQFETVIAEPASVDSLWPNALKPIVRHVKPFLPTRFRAAGKAVVRRAMNPRFR